MRILELKFEGFRSLASQEWRPGRLNLLIGPNAGGKSNVLRALELLSTAARGGLGKYVQQEGGIEPLLFDGKMNSVKLDVKMSPPPPFQDESTDALTYRIDLERLGQSSAYRIGHEVLGNFCDVEAGRSNRPYLILLRDTQSTSVFSVGTQKFEAVSTTTTTTTPAPYFQSISPQVPAATILAGKTPDEEAFLASMSGPFSLNPIASDFRQELASWRILQDFQTHHGAAIRLAQVSRHETVVDGDGQNLIPVLHTLYTGNRNFETEVDTAMQSAFGSDYEKLVFPPAGDQRIQLRLRWRSLEHARSAADLSDGTLRFLFLLTVLANPNPPPLIAIDEPETGLHPSMLPIVAEFARDAASRTQVILTTHSAEFLDAFGSDAPTTTVVERMEGQTHLRVIDGEELAYWLKQYALGELFRSQELEAMK